MLDAFQVAALAVADKEVGALAPLYEFYPAIEGYLEAAVRYLKEGRPTSSHRQTFSTFAHRVTRCPPRWSSQASLMRFSGQLALSVSVRVHTCSATPLPPTWCGEARALQG